MRLQKAIIFLLGFKVKTEFKIILHPTHVKKKKENKDEVYYRKYYISLMG